jgi:FkbM family methyltransferase
MENISEKDRETLVAFTTPFGVLACRPSLDGKAIKHLEAHGVFMESDFALMRAFVSPNDVIIDVGANLGAFAIPLALFARTVHAFEPIPETADHLEYNIAQNSRTNIVVHRVGLSDVPGVLYPHRTADSGSTSLTEIKEKSDRPDETIHVTTLDELFSTEKISFMKIDVEGMEERVLRGAQKFIAHSRPVIFFEVQKGNMSAFAVSFKALTNLFPKYDFYFNLHVPQDGTYVLGKLPWLGFLAYASGTQNALAVPKEYTKPFVYKSLFETVAILVTRKIRNFLSR